MRVPAALVDWVLDAIVCHYLGMRRIQVATFGAVSVGKDHLSFASESSDMDAVWIGLVGRRHGLLA